MKEALETLDRIRQLPLSTLLEFGGFLALYFTYTLWKAYLSEKAKLEIQRQRLDVLKLGLEIEALKVSTPRSTLATTIDCILRDIRQQFERPKSTGFSLQWGVWQWRFRDQVKTLLIAASGALSSCIIYMVAVLAQIPQGTAADSLRAIVVFQVLITSMCMVLPGIACLVFKIRTLSTVFITGAVGAFLIIPVAAWLFSVFLRIWLLFLNAH